MANRKLLEDAINHAPAAGFSTFNVFMLSPEEKGRSPLTLCVEDFRATVEITLNLQTNCTPDQSVVVIERILSRDQKVPTGAAMRVLMYRELRTYAMKWLPVSLKVWLRTRYSAGMYSSTVPLKPAASEYGRFRLRMMSGDATTTFSCT